MYIWGEQSIDKSGRSTHFDKNKKYLFSNLVVVFVCSEGRANDDEVRLSPCQVPSTARVRPIRLVLRIREKVFRSEDAISIKLNIRKI